MGLSVPAFTALHVAISIVAIATGLLVAADMVRGAHRGGLVDFFLATTVLTSVTGFMFPAPATVTPAQIFGYISLAVLALALVALHLFDRKDMWRAIYIIASMFALYLNTFVAVVQSFQKLAPLARLAPTQSEPPFLVAQLVLLAAFLVVGWLALRRSAPIQSGRLAS